MNNIEYKIVLLILLTYSSYTDIKNRVVMMIPIYVCFFIAIIGLIFPMENEDISLIGIVPGIIILLIGMATKGAIGDGDAYLIMIIGMFMGMRNAFYILLTGSVISAIYALTIIFLKGKSKKEVIPFVPFILSGYLGVLLIGQ